MVINARILVKVAGIVIIKNTCMNKQHSQRCKELLVNYCIAMAVITGIVTSYIITTSHRCKWPLCPYKGVKAFEFKRAVLIYTGQPESSEGFKIDFLHLQHPNESYHKLESRLLEPD